MISNSNYETHKDEVELLKNILFEQLKIIEEIPNFIIEVDVKPDKDEPKLDFKIKLSLPNEYPDSSPIFEVTDLSNHLSSTKLKLVNDRIKTLISENLGMPMVYQIVEIVKEFANEMEEVMQLEHISKITIEEEKQRKYMQKIQNNDLIETKSFTPVTKEGFETWFKKFYEKSKKNKPKQIEGAQTGREYFMNLKNIKMEELDIDEDKFEQEENLNNEEDKALYFDEGAFDENINDIDFDQIEIDEI